MTKIKYIFGLILILILAGCNTQIGGMVIANKNSFEREFKKVLAIDKKYDASFYTEALDVENRFSDVRIYDFDWDRTIVRIENIPLMIEELDKMRDVYYKKEMTEDNKAIILFIKARIKMLESQRMYLLGISFGSDGDTYDGFRCSERPYILNMSYYFNESATICQEATGIFDKLLTYFPQTREFFTNDNRPKFYDSPFWPIKKHSISNRATVEQLCKK